MATTQERLLVNVYDWQALPTGLLVTTVLQNKNKLYFKNFTALGITTVFHVVGDAATQLQNLKKHAYTSEEAQTFFGIKTFDSIPELPASNPSTLNQASRKQYVDDRAGINYIVTTNADPVIYTIDPVKVSTVIELQHDVGTVTLTDAVGSTPGHRVEVFNEGTIAVSVTDTTDTYVVQPGESAGFYFLDGTLEQFVAGGGGGSNIVGTGMSYYDTGWITATDWTNAVENIIHNLDADVNELITVGYTSTTEYGIQQTLFNFAGNPDGGVRYGATIESNSNVNNCNLRFAEDAPVQVHTTSGVFVKISTLTDPKYRIVFYKPNDTDIIFPIDQVTHKYDTGWFTPADWTNALVNIAHGLNVDFKDLIVKGYSRSDGNEEQEILNGNYNSGSYGAIPENNNDLNNFNIRLGQFGIQYLNNSTGILEALPLTTNPEIRYIVYKPELITENLTDVTYKYDTGWITSPVTSSVTNIAHGLGADAQDLIIEGWTKSDNLGEQKNLFRTMNVGGYYGAELFDASDVNNFDVKYSQFGPMQYSAASSYIPLNSQTNPKIRIIVYRPALITENVVPIQDEIMNNSKSYTLTSNDIDTQMDATNCISGQTLTLVQGAGASFGNKVTLNNLSTNLIIVTDTVTTFWVDAGETVSFWFSGTALKRNSGLGLIFDDYSNAGNITISTGVPMWEFGNHFHFLLGNSTTPATEFAVNGFFSGNGTSNQTGDAGSSSYLSAYWLSGAPTVLSASGGYGIKKIWREYK